MCQLCGIVDIAYRDRWPKPLEHFKKEIDFLVTSAHDEYTTHQSSKQSNKTDKLPDGLLDMLRLLADLLNEAESSRQAWWSSPEKREVRRRLDEQRDQIKLSQLHKINNTTTESIEVMDAKLGGFVKWSLGMNGGSWVLRGSDKVEKGDTNDTIGTSTISAGARVKEDSEVVRSGEGDSGVGQ